MHEENKFLQFIYTFFLGITIALFIGIGINTFYPQPDMPQPPETLNSLNNLNKQPTEQQIALQNSYDISVQDFNKNKMNPYNRNVSIITLATAIILVALSMLLEHKNIKVIADGVMVGGLLTLLYSVGRGVASQDNQYMFGAVAVGLALVLYLGYHRFVAPYKAHAK